MLDIANASTNVNGFEGEIDEKIANNSVPKNIGAEVMDQVRCSLDSVKATSLSRPAIASALVRHRGASDEQAMKLFADWSRTRHSEEDDGKAYRDEMADDAWQLATNKAFAPDRNGLIDYSLSQLLEVIERAKRLVGETGEWPVLAPKTGKPDPRSQMNIAAFLSLFDLSVYRDDFSGRYHIRNFQSYDELSDEALTDLRLMADRLGLRARKDFFDDTVLSLARQSARHPVREYFDEQQAKWDGKRRLSGWLVDYAGAENTELNREIGQLFMAAVVRRVRKPGVKFDYLPVLEGEQGVGKSSLAKVLVGEQWFDDTLVLGTDPKQVIEQTAGKLIVEISELRGSGREVELVKAMISRTHDTARMAYARKAVTVPRQFAMIGTTNASQYLLDATGNRRYLPVKIEKVDLKGLAADRDQLWAEAAVVEEQWRLEGRTLELPVHLRKLAGEEQRDRELSEPFQEEITAHLEDFGGWIDMDTLFHIVGLDKEKRERRSDKHAQSIGRAMARLGWKRERVRIDGAGRSYVYRKRAAVEYRFTWESGRIETAPAALIGQSPEPPAERKVVEMRRRRRSTVTGG